jgi:hypothetical protein
MRFEDNGVTPDSQSSSAPRVGSNNSPANRNGATPLKSAVSEKHSNGMSVVRNGLVGKLDVGGLSESEGKGTRVRSNYYGHDREEVTRILIQALMDLGYYKAATKLESESEYTLESPHVSNFRHAVLKGDWNIAEKLLEGMEIHQDADSNVSFACSNG